MKNEIIVVKQLPVIAEQLQTIKAEVTERVATALSLVCTEETVKTIKTARAELTKEFSAWEGKRKEVKKAVMSPYEQFEAVYKDCITDVFTSADKELKEKIDSVENELKEKKRLEVLEYFAEYYASKNIDVPLTFDNCGVNVTLSASMKSMKEKVKSAIDKVCDDLELINTFDLKDEILYEYKKTLNVSGAITAVTNRRKAIEEAKAKKEEQQAKKQAVEKAVEKVENIAPPVEEEPLLTVAFKVTGTRSKLKELKAFLVKGNYQYE